MFFLRKILCNTYEKRDKITPATKKLFFCKINFQQFFCSITQPDIQISSRLLVTCIEKYVFRGRLIPLILQNLHVVLAHKCFRFFQIILCSFDCFFNYRYVWAVQFEVTFLHNYSILFQNRYDHRQIDHLLEIRQMFNWNKRHDFHLHFTSFVLILSE